MHAARGILTTRGGMTSHAAVVARGMGRACVAGAGDLRVDYKAQTVTVRGVTLKAGDLVTIDGSTGEVMLGAVPTIQPELSGDFATLMGWADEIRRMKVRTNAETPLDARTAVKFGAEGIGLSRTEHMFFDADRIVAVREMILAESEQGRRAASPRSLRCSEDVELFTIMKGLPVPSACSTRRGFLPNSDAEMEGVRQGGGHHAGEGARGAATIADARPSRLPSTSPSRRSGDAGALDLRAPSKSSRFQARP